MNKDNIKELKYDFDCKVATVYCFLEMFSIVNGERAVRCALDHYLDERNHAIVANYDKKILPF